MLFIFFKETAKSKIPPTQTEMYKMFLKGKKFKELKSETEINSEWGDDGDKKSILLTIEISVIKYMSHMYIQTHICRLIMFLISNSPDTKVLIWKFSTLIYLLDEALDLGLWFSSLCFWNQTTHLALYIVYKDPWSTKVQKVSELIFYILVHVYSTHWLKTNICCCFFGEWWYQNKFLFVCFNIENGIGTQIPHSITEWKTGWGKSHCSTY